MGKSYNHPCAWIMVYCLYNAAGEACSPKSRRRREKFLKKNECVNYYTYQLLHILMYQFLHISMSNFLHFPSIIAHLYVKKAVSLHIEIQITTFINVYHLRSGEWL